MRRSCGFTVIELIAVLIIVGVIGSVTIPRLLPSSTYQLQASRDLIVTAFLSAQQLAMVRNGTVTFEVDSGEIDVQLDSTSIRTGGTQFPVTILPNQSLTDVTITFDKLGQPSTSANLSLVQSGHTVPIVITQSGYAY